MPGLTRRTRAAIVLSSVVTSVAIAVAVAPAASARPLGCQQYHNYATAMYTMSSAATNPQDRRDYRDLGDYWEARADNAGCP
jgi:hypothetical protein